MNKATVIVVAALFAVLFCAHPASAQNITILSGDGQLICQTCFSFAPMMVRVTDSNGVPQANVTVNWAISSGFSGATLGSGSTTTTLTDGTTTNTYYVAGLTGFFQQGNASWQYAQNTVSATTTTANVLFHLTQALADQTNYSYPAVLVNVPLGGILQDLLAGEPLRGPAGSTGSEPIRVQVVATRGGGTINGVNAGTLIPNVSVQLVNYQDQSVGPVVHCAGAAGGELNTVFTDASGTATCYPVFGGVPSTPGKFYVLVGAGGAPPIDPTAAPFNNFSAGFQFGINLTVTPAQPGFIKVTQGNNQSAAPGQTLANLLQVEVDTAAGVPVASQPVNWTATPAVVNFSSVSPSTDQNGRASANVTFFGTASGAVQITATCPACATIKSFTFTVTAVPPVPIVTVTGLQIVSGNNQSVLVNTIFGLPLVLQVNASNGQPAANTAVQFSVTGPASLSSSTVNTDSNGRAQVSVQAGGTAGSVTVTATAGSFTQSFSLTVTPPGPVLTSSSFYNGADFQAGSISPCSIATIIAQGVAPSIQGVVTSGSLFGPLPYLLASDTVTFNGSPAPIFNVANVNGQQQITLQVPCDVAPSSSVPITVTVGSAPGSTVNVPVLAASPGIFQTQMSDGVYRAVLIRPDGSFVSLTNPARRGEIVRAYATGLGVTSPVVGTNATAIPGTDALVQGTLIMGVTNSSGQGEGVRVSNARVAPDLIGVFEIPFQMPSDAATGNNVSFSIGVIPVGSSTPIYSVTAKMPIQ